MSITLSSFCKAESQEKKTKVRYRVDRIMRFVFGITAGGSEMTIEGEDSPSWSYVVGVEGEMTLASPGLTPVLRAGYLIQNNHFKHAIPVDIAGRYFWKGERTGAFISIGMSLFTGNRKIKNTDGETDYNWEINPLVYLDSGMRFMFKPDIGLDIRIEYRTYIVINVLSLMVGVAF